MARYGQRISADDFKEALVSVSYPYVERRGEQSWGKEQQYPPSLLFFCLCVALPNFLALSQESWPQDFRRALEEILAFMQIYQPSDTTSASTSYFPWKKLS